MTDYSMSCTGECRNCDASCSFREESNWTGCFPEQKNVLFITPEGLVEKYFKDDLFDIINAFSIRNMHSNIKTEDVEDYFLFLLTNGGAPEAKGEGFLMQLEISLRIISHAIKRRINENCFEDECAGCFLGQYCPEETFIGRSDC